LLKLFVFFAEAFYATGGINQFLLAGKKWMALRADLDPYIRFGRADLQNIATGALNCGLVVLWMDICFHFISIL
jgi:hypothetical protein